MSWITALLVALILGVCLIRAANAIAWAIADSSRGASQRQDTARIDATRTDADAVVGMHADSVGALASGASLHGTAAPSHRLTGVPAMASPTDDLSRTDHERWLLAMNADSVLGATTRRTLDQLSELMLHARGLSSMAQDAVAEATAGDSQGTSLDVEAEPFHRLFERSRDVAQRIGTLRLAVSAAPHLAEKGQSDDCVTALFAFNRALTAAFAN
jgi:hypothetical protein